MKNFTYSISTVVHFGKGQISKLGGEIASRASRVLVVYGGGSVIDCSKAIAAGACYDGDPWDFPAGKAVPEKALPIFTVLTMAATGSAQAIMLAFTAPRQATPSR